METRSRCAERGDWGTGGQELRGGEGETVPHGDLACHQGHGGLFRELLLWVPWGLSPPGRSRGPGLRPPLGSGGRLRGQVQGSQSDQAVSPCPWHGSDPGHHPCEACRGQSCAGSCAPTLPCARSLGDGTELTPPDASQPPFSGL